MKLVRGNREHGNSENTFRTIRRATGEDSDHLPMQRHSDFAVCCNKQACKPQFLKRFQIFGQIHHRFREGFTCILRRLIWVYTVCSGLSVRIRRVSTEIRSNRIPSEIILDLPLIHKKMLGPTRKIHHQGICN